MRFLTAKAGAMLCLAAGVLLAAPAAASASAGATCHRVHQQAVGNFGILTGNNIYLPLDLGLDASGNAIGILGLASATRGNTYYKVRCGN